MASRKVTPDISLAWAAVQLVTQAGSRLLTSRAAQPIALRMKNSFSASIEIAYRSKRARSGRPERIPGSRARTADRRTQKSASVAHPSMRGHPVGSCSATVPVISPASVSTSAQVRASRISASTVARSSARNCFTARQSTSTAAIRRSCTGSRHSATAQASRASRSRPGYRLAADRTARRMSGTATP